MKIPPKEVLKQALADHRNREVARGRMGTTAADRLRWLVERFARLDLSRLRPEERLAIGYDLRALPLPGASTASYPRPLSDGVLREIHESFRTGLRNLLRPADAAVRIIGLDQKRLSENGEVAIDASLGWSLPAGEDRLVRVSADGVKTPRFILQTIVTDERVAILRAIAHVLMEAGGDLRLCARCRLPFVRVRRQEYCTADCSQAARVARRPSNKLVAKK